MQEKPKHRDYEGLALLTREVRDITKKALGARGFSGLDILQSWTDIVGADLAKGVFPQKLVFEKQSRAGGTLIVKTAGGAFAMLLEHNQARVLQRINAFFGYPAVARIKMIQGALKLDPPKQLKAEPILSPEQKNSLREAVEIIADENLRRRTYEIGKILKTRAMEQAQKQSENTAAPSATEKRRAK